MAAALLEFVDEPRHEPPRDQEVSPNRTIPGHGAMTP